MTQFTVYRNPNPATRARLPLLLDLQSPLLNDLASCVVAPLMPMARQKSPSIRKLMPILEVGGASYVMITPQLAGVPRKVLGEAVGDVSAQRGEIVAALDLIFTGI
jgi:toxin CcdB